MIKLKITFETKKGCPAETLWGIRQIPPYPDFDTACGEIKWRNTGGLFPPWRPNGNTEKPSIGAWYICDLLRSDQTEHDLSTRASLAGWKEYRHENDAPAPGSFDLRGVYMGEIQVTFEGDPSWPSIRVRGCQDPTAGEQNFIKDNICIPLSEAIETHRAQLKADAIAELRARVEKQVDETHKLLTKLEIQIKKAIDEAEKGGK